MATTPPMRMMPQVNIPPAPRWGPSYDAAAPRYPTRSSMRAISGQSERRVTPETPAKRREEARHSHTTPLPKQRPTNTFHRHLSPPTSPTRLSTSKRSFRSQVHTQTLSPTSPSTQTRSHDSLTDPFTTAAPPPPSLRQLHPSLAPGNWLPTPIKTPVRTTKTFKSAARVLFQDQLPEAEDIMPSPRKTKRVKKHNGFSLASSGDSGVQIYTDSRDQVPEMDRNKDNPFSEQPEEPVVQNHQKRKLRSRGRSDPEVTKAIKDNEGIVYTFRGKKFLKKFEDKSNDEDSAGEDNDGLRSLDGVSPATRALSKPLNRNSIKPKRLFQTPEQIRQREAEKAEEATTDEEKEETNLDSTAAAQPNNARLSSAEAPARTLDSLRLGSGESTTSREHHMGEGDDDSPSEKSKRAVKFQVWKRTKSAPISPDTPVKGRKRTSSTMEVEDGDADEGSFTKKLRSH